MSDAHAPPSPLWGGIALAAAAVAALIVANTPLRDAYDALLGVRGAVILGEFRIDKPLLLWINDGLMAVFFLLVGLEIKRELLVGELAGWRRAALPAIAATGGFIVPALIFVALNRHDPVTLKAWAVPTATDIAFVVGVVAALGRAVPASLRAFVVALAIIDDLMAIVVIALFYTADLSLMSLAVAGVCLALLAAFNRLGVRHLAPYILVGVVMWASVLKSGVHATLAGVALGLAIPLDRQGGRDSPLATLEHGLAPWVTFLIVPVFAFANAGVSFAGVTGAAFAAPLTLGVAAGLFVGKQLGVFAAAWAAVKLRLAAPPEDATWSALYGVALLTGVGFTMSLFIGSLALPDESHQTMIRIGVLGGSLLSAAMGAGVLLLAARARRAP